VPELPEVETVARLIRPHLVGRHVTGTRVLWERSLGGRSRTAFARAVRGSRIERVGRRGKFVVMELGRASAPGGALLVHLRMSGRLFVGDPAEDPGPYLRVALDLDDGRRLAFVDVRKFGRFLFSPRPAEVLGRLGPEPLDAAFGADAFAAALRARRGALKPLLLDQGFVAGLGNIYVDEALHGAGLHPTMPAARVDDAGARRLHAAIRRTLRAAIAREGSSFDTFYRTPEGRPGSYQDRFRVYGRQGEPCRTCGTPIERIVVGQRGTHVCPRCQLRPRRRRRAGRAGTAARGRSVRR